VRLDDGRQQMAYAHGVQRVYFRPRKALSIYRGYRDKSAPSKAPGTRTPNCLTIRTNAGTKVTVHQLPR
jgi:hypothetical protein